MKEIIISISQILGDILRVECQEDLQSFKCELNLMLTNVPSAEELQALLPNIADRDSWRLRLLTETGDDLFDIKSCHAIHLLSDSSDVVLITTIISSSFMERYLAAVIFASRL